MRPPRYPINIIPKPYFKAIMDLNMVPRACLVRNSRKSLEDTFNLNSETLKDDIISESEVPTLSLNILGGKFKLNHLRFRPFGIASNEWKKGERPSKKVYVGKYTDTKMATPIYFYLSDVHRVPFPYYRKDDPETRKFLRIFNIEEKRKENGEFQLEGVLRIIHAPTKLNYWHVQFDIHDITGKPLTASSTRSARKIIYNDIVCVKARRKVRKIKLIPKSVYLEVA